MGWNGTSRPAPCSSRPLAGAGGRGAPREGRAWGPGGSCPQHVQSRGTPGAGITRGFTGRSNNFYCRKLPVGFQRLRKVALNGSYFI